MINPNKLYNQTGKLISMEKMTSMTVCKINVKGKILDYTLFGYNQDVDFKPGQILKVTISYSITMNDYFIKDAETFLKLVG